jgi:hypothetical protein
MTLEREQGAYSSDPTCNTHSLSLSLYKLEIPHELQELLLFVSSTI